ncbi:hypothetical protein TVAG_010960 [Trichomonas vaginalis G3]|uniref:Uncharacterized protein n=1 Tax=Trichomonas vaginalis (strain ATCC PRA-98 / G3) TaxID=412133 RepID=A2DP22_TRIV3|nr:hypothetical protein TVAGG3_0989330 [Trichomonas vaginalis G3]EAY17871.1 hypothetical protein TVAG_010960 [Trichomonas vaginalis G3]KAI5489911.1 hypothetical protein TVAGG3_0989330 [Trichomonas vaginalis G3]|eukprot:XP_001330006.1 hypothetical protein [Trichomonas vaginalis G3]
MCFDSLHNLIRSILECTSGIFDLNLGIIFPDKHIDPPKIEAKPSLPQEHYPRGELIEPLKGKPIVYPSWIKVNDFPGDRLGPNETLQITPNPKLIEYFIQESENMEEVPIYRGKQLVHITDLLRFNRFEVLSDDDLTFLGQFAMMDFLRLYRSNDLEEIRKCDANKIGCIFEGIILDYAILYKADPEVINLIKEFATAVKYTEDFMFTDRLQINFSFHYYPTINYLTGSYLNLNGYTAKELGLEELHVVRKT